jgi:hypothetical protein
MKIQASSAAFWPNKLEVLLFLGLSDSGYRFDIYFSFIAESVFQVVYRPLYQKPGNGSHYDSR